MKSSLNINHDALFPLSWFFTMVTLHNVWVHVQANPLFQVAQPASSLKYFETHLRKERHRLPTMKLLLYVALFADLDPYQSVHHHHTGRPCSPREVQLEKSHYLQSAKLIECLGMQEVSCLTASRLVVLTRMSNVALHCLPVTAPPSVLQLISGFFFVQSLPLHESKGASSACGTLASFQIPHFKVFLFPPGLQWSRFALLIIKKPISASGK